MKVELSKEELGIIQTGLEVAMSESCISEKGDPVVKDLIEKLGLNKAGFPGYFPEEFIRDCTILRASNYVGFRDDLPENNKWSHRRIIDRYNCITPLPRGYKAQYTDGWSCIFASVVAFESGCQNIVPMECLPARQMEQFKQRGQWKPSDYEPKPGDFVYFDFEHHGFPTHVGIVTCRISKGITTIEGNFNHEVHVVVRTKPTELSCILGYGVPDYKNWGR